MNRLQDYENRLMGLIPPERIKTADVPRPSQEIIDAFYEMEGLTPTISDILDSLGVKGAIPASSLRPVIPGKKSSGRPSRFAIFRRGSHLIMALPIRKKPNWQTGIYTPSAKKGMSLSLMQPGSRISR